MSQGLDTRAKVGLVAAGATIVAAVITGICTITATLIEHVINVPSPAATQAIEAAPMWVDTPMPLPSATPGPTPWPLSSSDLILRDDFSSSDSEWDNYATEDSATGYESGRYFIEWFSPAESHGPIFFSIWKKTANLDSGSLQVDILGPFGEMGAVQQGLAFGWRHGWEGSTYCFTIQSAGTCEFMESSDRQWRSQKTGTIDGFDPKQGYHTLRVDIRHTEAIGYVDGRFCAAFDIPDYRPGYVGVVAQIWQGGGKAYFDEYRIYQLP